MTIKLNHKLSIHRIGFSEWSEWEIQNQDQKWLATFRTRKMARDYVKNVKISVLPR